MTEHGRLGRALWLAACVVLGAAACNGGDKAAAPGSDPADLPADRVMWGVEQNITVAGVRHARLTADTAYEHTDAAELDLRVVHIEMFDEAGARTGKLDAAAGTYNTRTQSMFARGHVVLISNRDGRTIQTEQLHYDPSTKRIWSDVKTVIHNRDGTVQTAKSFTSDIDFRNPQFNGLTGSLKGVTL